MREHTAIIAQGSDSDKAQFLARGRTRKEKGELLDQKLMGISSELRDSATFPFRASGNATAVKQRACAFR